MPLFGVVKPRRYGWRTLFLSIHPADCLVFGDSPFDSRIGVAGGRKLAPRDDSQIKSLDTRMAGGVFFRNLENPAAAPPKVVSFLPDGKSVTDHSKSSWMLGIMTLSVANS